MTKRTKIRRVVHLVGALFVGLAATVAVSPQSRAVAAVTPQQFVSVRGAGASSIYGPLVPWQNELASASSYVNMNYTPHGTLLGRQDLIAKRTDFVITGVPFSDAELAQAGGKDSFISAPVQAAAAAIYVEPTNVSGQPKFDLIRHLRSKDGTGYCNPDDESTWPAGVTDPDGCYSHEPLNSQVVHIPAKNLGAMLLNTRIGGLNTWNNPDVLKAFGLNPDAGDAINTAAPAVGPATAWRSDGDEMNYYTAAYTKAVSPEAWNNASNNATSVGERPLPSQGYTRDGAEAQIQLLANGGCGVNGAGCGAPSAPSGGLASTPPALITAFKNAYQNPQIPVACCQPLLTAQVQNAHGDWVAPTPDAITKAIAAGGDQMFHALDHDVPGAYPLAWVDRIYLPAQGLSVTKTEGLAMMLRYLVTTGQDREAPALEGRLSAPLVAQALAAADALVQSNCTGSDRTIVKSSDPGPLAPPSATEMKSIGPMLHCEPVGPQTTTTTTLPPGSLGGGGGSFSAGGGTGFGSVLPPASGGASGTGTGTGSGSTSAPTGTGGTGGSGGTTGAPKATNKKSALLVVDKLPIPAPTGSSATDRLAAFLLGVGLYLLLRKPTARLVKRLSS